MGYRIKSKITAAEFGPSPVLTAAISTGGRGQEGTIFRAVLGHSIALALMVGAIVWAYARPMPGWVAVAPVP